MIALERVYEPSAGAKTAKRFLVERLWPRGIKKEALQMDGWLRDVAPSTALRKWFGHDPAKWDAFEERYARELDAQPEAWEPLLEAARRGPVVLLFSSKDVERNNAVALKAYLERKLGRAGAAKGARTARRPSPSARRATSATRRRAASGEKHAS